MTTAKTALTFVESLVGRVGSSRRVLRTAEAEFERGHPPAQHPDRPDPHGVAGDTYRLRAASNISRESSKDNHTTPDDEFDGTQRRHIEELKAQVASQEYAFRNLEQERDMLLLGKDNEVREARRKADEDFRLRQAVDAEKDRVQRQAEQLANEMESRRTDGKTARREVERRARRRRRRRGH